MAYTKYSLTPADNNAAPPNGAPEGMLPSAVNDTMRDMMSQIRDVGDGIRGGTYTMTAPVITGGSINGTTVGAGTASTGAFTTLGATGVATFSAGTVSAPAITTTGDTNTGIFFPAADTIAFTEGGVESMRIDSSGRVGIGTSSPTQKLQVSGTMPAINGGNGQLQVFSTDSLAADKGGKIALGGVSGEGGSFDPYGFAYVAGLKENATSSNFSGYLAFGTSNSGGSVAERMRIDSSGNVGIGTTVAPGANGGGLAIYRSDYPRLTFRNSTTGDTTADGTTMYQIGNNWEMVNLESGYLSFGTSNTERMRIDSSGSVLIGGTSSPATTKLLAKGATTGAEGITVQETTGGASTRFYVGFYNSGNTKTGDITTNGTTTAYNTSSDYRLKENIAPMTGALDVVSQLKPVTYNWKSDGSTGQGFIAHELAEVVPDCVSGDKDAIQIVDDVDAQGKVIGTKKVPKYQGIDTSFLVATLTAAIQELKAELDSVKAELQTLKGN